MGRIKRTVEIGAGNACPKCRRQMVRSEHGPSWKPKQNQPYYFNYWDKCRRCHHVQHYEVAKVMLVEEGASTDPLTEEFKAVMG